MRLDKLLAELTGMTRSKAREAIQGGRVCVDGEVKTVIAEQVNEDAVCVTLDGQALVFRKYVYYMLNKPAGTVSATQDRSDKTVIGLLSEEERKRRNLFPVGRLDKDTEGLLLITDDGALSHRMLSPKNHVDKLYFAKLAREITGEDIALFASGMKVDEELTALPAALRRLNPGKRRSFCRTGERLPRLRCRKGSFIR